MPSSTRLTTTAAAVRDASGANRLPSNFSPPSAKKTAWGGKWRLSVHTPPEATLSKGPLTSFPPMTLQMPCAVREIMKERRNNVLCLGEFFPFLDEHVAAHFLGVTEINAAGGKFLVIFMALARNEDDVPQTGLLDGRGNEILLL